METLPSWAFGREHRLWGRGARTGLEGAGCHAPSLVPASSCSGCSRGCRPPLHPQCSRDFSGQWCLSQDPERSAPNKGRRAGTHRPRERRVRPGCRRGGLASDLQLVELGGLSAPWERGRAHAFKNYGRGGIKYHVGLQAQQGPSPSTPPPCCVSSHKFIKKLQNPSWKEQLCIPCSCLRVGGLPTKLWPDGVTNVLAGSLEGQSGTHALALSSGHGLDCP